VASFNWSSTQVSGTNLAAVLFPQALMVPNILAKLDYFQYLRAGIKFSFRLNTTTMHSGKLLVAYLPEYSPTATFKPFTNIFAASSNPHVLISANSAVTAEITIPYVHPRSYWNMSQDYNTAGFAPMGAVYVYVLHPLSSAASITTVTTQVIMYASFVNPETAGYGLHVITSSIKPSVPHGQMERLGGADQKKEAEVRSEKGIISDVARAVQRSAFRIADIPFLSPYAKKVGEGAGTFAGWMEAIGLSKPTSVQASNKVRLDPNSGFAQVSGLDGCDVLSLDPENHVSNDLSLYGEMVNYDDFRNYVLCPTLIALGSFDETAPPDFAFWNAPVCPTICNKTIFALTEIFDTTHICNVAKEFKYWRGPMRYHLVLTTNTFNSCRVRWSWIADPTFTGSIPNSQAGDIVSSVIDVNGDTSSSITVPYLREEAWQVVPDIHLSNLNPITNWSGYNGQISLRIVNPPVSAQNDVQASTVYFAIYCSGGPGTEFARPVSLDTKYSDPYSVPLSQPHGQMERIATATDIRAHFLTDFPSIVPTKSSSTDGLQMGEHIGSWTALLKRYTLLSNFAPEFETGIQGLWDNTDITVNFTTHWRIRRTFLYSRGSIRLKLQVTSEIGNNTIIGTNFFPADIQKRAEFQANYDTFASQGIAMTQSSVRNVLEVQIPFYCPYLMHSQIAMLDIDGQLLLLEYPAFQWILSGAADSINLYAACADDFTLAWPVTPVPLQRSTAPFDKKAVAPYRKTAFCFAKNLPQNVVSDNNSNPLKEETQPLDGEGNIGAPAKVHRHISSRKR